MYHPNALTDLPPPPRGTNPLYPPNMGLLGPREGLETSMYSLSVSNECLKSHTLFLFLPSFFSSSSPLHVTLSLPSSFHPPHHIHFVHFGIFLSMLFLSIVSFSYSLSRTEEGSKSYFEITEILITQMDTACYAGLVRSNLSDCSDIYPTYIVNMAFLRKIPNLERARNWPCRFTLRNKGRASKAAREVGGKTVHKLLDVEIFILLTATLQLMDYGLFEDVP
jgi:hypothetical protein